MIDDPTTFTPEPAPEPSSKRFSPGINLLIIFGSLLAVMIAVGWSVIFLGLPREAEIREFKLTSSVESFGNFDWEKERDEPIRKVVPLSAIAENLQKSVIISEDDTFWHHDGVNFQMMKEAWKVNLDRGRYARGASTITMQLARNAFLNKEKTILRKIREIIVARRIEKVLNKRQVLELYLNLIEWGENVYGAEAAAQYHFSKSANYLNWSEASMLAGILPNPLRFSPFRRVETARKFQKRVLDLLVISKIIDAQTAAAAFAVPVHLRGQMAFAAPLPIDSLTTAPIEIEEDSIFAISLPEFSESDSLEPAPADSLP
jgi:monofunctional biosynthetic peptidoglycan transglycosylase